MTENKTENTEYLTSTNHAFALCAYLIVFIQGIMFLSGVAQSRGVEAIIGEHSLLFTVWSFGFLVFGLAAFVSALISPFFVRPNFMLQMEFYSVIGVSAVNLLYEIGLLTQGLDFAPTTQLFALAFVIGGIVRAIQIQLDLRILRLRMTRKVTDEFLSSL